MNADMTINTINETTPKKKKNPFKTLTSILLYIIKYAYRGFIFLFKETPVNLWNRMSRSVDTVYKTTIRKNDDGTFTEEVHEEKKKKSILNMDLKDLFANSVFMKKKMAKLEEDKKALQIELQGSGGVRSKEPQIYRFTAKNPDGKMETDIISGYSKLDIHTFLVQDGYDVYKIETNQYLEKFYGQSSLFAPKFKTKDLLFWLTQLSTYIKSGITLTEAIRILNMQMGKNKVYKRAFQSIVYELTMGESFSSALEKQGTIFPPLLINMIKAAEATGELEATLDDMANYYDEIDKTHKQMISALAYPIAIMLFATVIVIFILVKIIPSFVEMYASADAEIPAFTLMVIHFSDYLQQHGITVFIMLFGTVAGLIFAYKKIKAFRKRLQTILMHIPFIGNVIIYNEMTIFTKTFSSLLRNNVFITESIEILSKITTNEVYKDIMYNTIQNILDGEKISLSFKDHWAVPDVAYYMIVTGESTGELAEMMGKVSTYYQEMHRSLINGMKSFIEPVMIIILAVIVGAILLSVILPMFGIINEIQM